MATGRMLDTPAVLAPPRRAARLLGRLLPSRSALTPYLFIAPNMALFTVFVFLPLLYAFYISLQEWSLIDTPGFIGLQNYVRLATDRAVLAVAAAHGPLFTPDRADEPRHRAVLALG